MIDMSYLSKGGIYWNEWRFVPWRDGSAEGLYRRAEFIKAGVIGEVARYSADDYIVWKYEEEDVHRIFKTVRSQKGVMMQRFVFVRPEGLTESKCRSFMLGFLGFIEIFRYSPLGKPLKQFKDLTPLIDAAHRYALKHRDDEVTE